MADVIFVTGGTGLTGANVCEQLIARGDSVRALVRNPADAEALTAIGVEVVAGDIADPDDVSRASKGCDAAIHCAALLGGASQDMADFHAVNTVGTTNVLDAAKSHGMRRVVALSTATFINLTTDAPFEEAPVLDDPPDDPYTVTKLAAFREAHARADAGEDIVTCHPGAIYGPGLVAQRALHRTSFNRVLLAGMRGRLNGLPDVSRDVGGRARRRVRLDRSPRPRRGRRALPVDRQTGGHRQHGRRVQPRMRDSRGRPSGPGSRLPLRPGGTDGGVRPHPDGDRRGRGPATCARPDRPTTRPAVGLATLR